MSPLRGAIQHKSFLDPDQGSRNPSQTLSSCECRCTPVPLGRFLPRLEPLVRRTIFSMAAMHCNWNCTCLDYRQCYAINPLQND